MSFDNHHEGLPPGDSGLADAHKASTAHEQSATGRQPRVSSRTLLGARRELIIEHQGREYRLRVTRNEKLILTA